METTAVPSIAEEFAPLSAVLETVASVIEIFAIVVLLNGLVRFVIAYVAAELRFRDPEASTARMNGGRIDLSRYILAGLEVFIVSDIIRTVLSPTLDSLAVLGALVLIRSAISFFLEREVRDIGRTGGEAVIALLALMMLSPAASAQEPAADLAAIQSCLATAGEGDAAERACIGVRASACLDTAAAATSMGMADCFGAEGAAWDELLNEAYRDLMREAEAFDAGVADMPDIAAVAPLLREAQRAWLAFRDADCAQETAIWTDGSMRFQAGAACLMERTAERTLDLIGKRREMENF